MRDLVFYEPGNQSPDGAAPDAPLHLFNIHPKYLMQHSLSVANIQIDASNVML